MMFTNLEIEQALLGAMFHSEPAALAKLDYNEGDFSEPFHWEIYKQIRSGKKLFNFAGTSQYDYLQSLADAAPMPLIQDPYADTLKELGRKRKIYHAMHEALEDLEEKESSEVIGYLNGKINETAEIKQVKSRAEIRKDISASLDLPKACYPTGMSGLDTLLMGGFYEGYTYGFCGAEKAGKTTLAHTISNRLPCKHLYIAMEMGAMQIEQRNLARDLGINSLKFLQNPDGLKNKVDTVKPNDNLLYYDAPGATVEELLHTVQMTIIKHDIKGFVLDYWQLVGGQQRGESEEKHLRHVAQSVANFARKNKVWCILLAQMNQDGKLFGGNGLKKACDQLYMIEQIEDRDDMRWLRMDASRYTPKGDLGSAEVPGLSLNTKVGPYFELLV